MKCKNCDGLLTIKYIDLSLKAVCPNCNQFIDVDNMKYSDTFEMIFSGNYDREIINKLPSDHYIIELLRKQALFSLLNIDKH
jgi:hypothetical protein